MDSRADRTGDAAGFRAPGQKQVEMGRCLPDCSEVPDL